MWVKMMADRYPVQSYLHRCGLAQSTQCPYCQEQCETLAHFTTICPRFREARTAGHNQVRAKLTSLLLRCLPKQQWKLFEETPMRRTGLELQQVSVACMVAAARLPQGHQGETVSVENLQPDMVLAYWISAAPLTLCRSNSLQLAGANSTHTRLCWRRCGRMWHSGGR